MKSVFITGTDTEVGKTIVCGLLANYLAGKDHTVVTQKWIQTGSENLPPDIAVHLDLMGKNKSDIEDYLSDIAPYTFRLPASPHLAAALEKKRIDATKIKESFQRLSKKFEFVIVEGIGGALVPFNKKNLVIDIAQQMALPVIIVAANKLGAINHTLLTIEALKARDIKILGIIFNAHNEIQDKIVLEDNPKIIKTLTGEKILGTLLWSKDRPLLYEAFEPIGRDILLELTK